MLHSERERLMTFRVGSLRQSCLAQALNEADAVLRPPERRRYPVNIAKAQRERFGLALADETLAARKKKGKAA
jgi:hypothetical protein